MKSSEIKKSKINKAIGSNLLVAIGINTYERIHGNLDNCVSDASLVFDTFSKEEYLLMNSNSCKILSDNQNTTKNEILNKLQKTVAMCNSNVNIIIYYSGHGCIIDDVFYFVATDSNDSKETMISLDDVLNIINSVEKRNVSIWIDACRKIIKTKSVNEESFNFKKTYIEKSRGMGIIYSCSKGEYSLDSFNDKKISVFTSLLIDTLKGCKTALKIIVLPFDQCLIIFMMNPLRQVRKIYILINIQKSALRDLILFMLH